MELLFCGTGWLPIVDILRARLPAGATLRVRDRSRPIAEQVAGVDVILPSNGRIDAAVMAAAPRLRLIQQPASGIDSVDLEAARARGIPVCNAPGQNGEAVAETALALMLALARRFPAARRAFSERRLGEPLGVELGGKTLGIIGLGRSGRRLADVARALGMEVVAVRSTSTTGELEALLRSADVVSIHCPLDDRTRGLIDDRALSTMKRGAFLVNCARGPIVDRAALVRALESGQLGGAGLDVHWNEPPDPDDPLYAREDVVALPHVGGSTREAFERHAAVIVDNLARLERGAPLLHRLA
jgi:phosphoglycerate dehydrogenase-like enzyme